MIGTTITRIPVPSEILKGEWYGIVYAIDTESDSLEEHNNTVDESVISIQSDFDNNHHWSVSLREVKRELVFSDERTNHYCTLVQFRVRDSY
jgi:hypothetical protein